VDQIRIGQDGVLLKRSGRSAVFLPQVAPEQGWTRNEMLDNLCRKAGLASDCWKQDAEFQTFQAVIFSEP
jgi:AMMECR1 domain-containing protein